MKTNEKDILSSRNELKSRPYNVPDGYFDSFRAEMFRVSLPAPAHTAPWRKAAPYMTIAASLALLVTAGTLALNRFSAEKEISQEDYILFSDNLISTSIYEDHMQEQIAEVGLMDEEIIEYLIFTGVSPEIIELSK